MIKTLSWICHFGGIISASLLLVFPLECARAEHADIENILATCDYPRVMGEVSIGFRDSSTLEFQITDYFKKTTVQIPVKRAIASDRYGYLEFICNVPGCVVISELPLQPGLAANSKRRSGYSFPYCEDINLSDLVRQFRALP